MFLGWNKKRVNIRSGHARSRTCGKYCNQRGAVALLMVFWMMFAITGLLFLLVSTNAYNLMVTTEVSKRTTAVNAALFCKNLLFIELSQNAGFVPGGNFRVSFGDSGGFGSGFGNFNTQYKKGACRVLSFEVIPINGVYGGNYYISTIEGDFINHKGNTEKAFTIETKISISAEAGSIPTIEYTKEISET